MVDDQRTPDEEPTREDTSRGRGFGRFTSRFRRERGVAAVDDRPDAPTEIEDDEAGEPDASDVPGAPSDLPTLPASAAPPLTSEATMQAGTEPEPASAPDDPPPPGAGLDAPLADQAPEEPPADDAPAAGLEPGGEPPPAPPSTPPSMPGTDAEEEPAPVAPRPLRPVASVTEQPPDLPSVAAPPVPPKEPTPVEPSPADLSPVERASEEPASAEPASVAPVEPWTLLPSTPGAPAALAPVEPIAELEETADLDETAGPIGPRVRPTRVTAHLTVLTGLATMVILAFLLIEPTPRWLLLVGAAAVVFGLDGTLRQTWREPFSFGQETAPFLFVPALYMMAVPVLIEHNVSGELVLLVGLGAGLGFGALAWAEVASVRPLALEYDQARLIVTANTYLAGFAIFSLTYVFDIGLPAAVVATGIAAAMLSVEVLREGEVDPMETLGLSLVTGLVLGEVRWLLYYMPLDTYLAGLTLLLAFYFATGLLHSHVVRALNRVVAMEYTGIAAAGIALVVLARVVGLA